MLTFAMLNKFDKQFRLKNRINKRIQDLQFHLKNYTYRDNIFAAQKKRFMQMAYPLRISKLLQLHSRLDSYNTTPPKDYLKILKEFNALGTAEENIKNIFGGYLKPTSAGMSEFENLYFEKIKGNQVRARISELRYRLDTAITEACQKDWFVIFQTLTVSQENYQDVFKKGSSAWRDYIQTVERAIGSQVYKTRRDMEKDRKKGIRCHEYFAVVERGTKHGRLHIHVLHLCQKLPYGCSRDPNSGKTVPTNQQINGFSKFWRFGSDTPIACRFLANDAFTKLGWRWPYTLKKGTKIFAPREAKPPIALARYVSKYVTEEYCKTKRKEISRCRMSRNLGMNPLMKIMRQSTINSLKQLSMLADPRMFRQKRMISPPSNLIRTEASREIMSRISSKMVMTLRRECQRQPTLIEQLRTMIPTKQIYKWRKITNLTIPNSPNMDGFNDVARRWGTIGVENSKAGGFASGPLSLTG